MVQHKLQIRSLLKTLVLSSVLIAIISGCSSKRTVPPYTPNKSNRQPPATTQQTSKHNITDENGILAAIYDTYNQYYGAPYKYGGNTKKGIDCSAFTQKIYKKSFNINLSRTTSQQLKHGHFVKPSLMKSGDLVFFKINNKLSHVGVYTRNGNFIHVSTKRGVSETSLTRGYWQNKIFKVKRVL